MSSENTLNGGYTFDNDLTNDLNFGALQNPLYSDDATAIKSYAVRNCSEHLHVLTPCRELAVLLAEVRKIGAGFERMNQEKNKPADEKTAQKEASHAEDLDDVREDLRALHETVVKMHDWMEKLSKTVDYLLKMQRSSEGGVMSGRKG